MRFLLDTNALIALLKGHPELTRRVRHHSLADFGIPSIAVQELYFGALKSQQRQTSLERIAHLRFEILPFDKDDTTRSGEIRAMLARARTPIGLYDVLIAGQALSRGLTVVTHNIREFAGVTGLHVEDWQEA